MKIDDKLGTQCVRGSAEHLIKELELRYEIDILSKRIQQLEVQILQYKQDRELRDLYGSTKSGR